MGGGLKKAIELIEKTFAGVKFISANGYINQAGLYLSFNGLTPLNALYDSAHFSIYFCANSLEGDNFAALTQIEELRKKVFMLGAKLGENIFKNCELIVNKDT
ncbi:hypothetical protein CFT13S00388_09650, partial [Campylobacter fetus subsp. testudinum]|uniref:hypothetical protein n=1 Tax=Campylobacter fetus TaxID=196 RepID=UPI000818A102